MKVDFEITSRPTKADLLAGCYRVHWDTGLWEQLEEDEKRELWNAFLYYFLPPTLTKAEREAWELGEYHCLSSAWSLDYLEQVVKHVRLLCWETFGVELTEAEIAEAYKADAPDDPSFRAFCDECDEFYRKQR
jgi:predicted Fe-S protein YdhL (DUF1289 family)